jgi:hypothetical protein
VRDTSRLDAENQVSRASALAKIEVRFPGAGEAPEQTRKVECQDNQDIRREVSHVTFGSNGPDYQVGGNHTHQNMARSFGPS